MNTLLFLSSFAVMAPASPLDVRQPAVNRGEVKAGAPLVERFELRNTGTKPLTITGVASGCGCTQPKISRREIPAGESADLDIAVNTLAQPAGPNTWRTTVRYSQADIAGEMELAITATVIREINLQPVSLFLSIDKESTHVFTLTDTRTKPLTIVSARCESKHIQPKLTATGVNAKGERIQQIHVTVLDSIPPGHHAETVLLTTDDPTYRELRLPITVNRKTPGQVLAAPEQIDLRLAKGQLTASGLVRLRDPDDKPVVIDRIEADHPSIRFKWAAGPGSMATVRLGIEVDAGTANGLGHVTVHLKEPRPQVVVIPLSWKD